MPIENLLVVVLGIHLIENLLDCALFVDDEGSSEGAHILASVHAFFAPYAHFLHQLLISVRHEGKRQIQLIYEL